MSDKSKKRNGNHPPSFGKLNRPAPRQPILSTEPSPLRKRSAIVALAALGTGALGMFAVASANRCQPNDPNQPPGSCRSSSSSGSYIGNSRWSSSSSTPSSNAVQRGGFGATGGHFSGHFGS